MLKKSLLVLSMFLLLFGMVGCSLSTDQSTEGAVSENEQIKVNQQETIYPLTIKDGTGTELTLSSEPKRIVSLIPSLTEALYAIGAGDSVVGVTIFDNYPKEAQANAEYVFEDALNPNLEQIIALNPDLIVMGPYNEELTEKIRSLNIPVAKYDPQNIDQVYQTIEGLGMITNKNDIAFELVSTMKEKEEAIIEKTKAIPDEEKVNVWVEIAQDYWTAGKGTFIDELVTKAGGINIVNENGWIQYSEEQIIASNPEVIITTYGYYDPNAVDNVYTRTGWQGIDAVVNKRVVNINDDLVNRPGPRIIDGLEEMAKTLYPNLFR